MIIGNKQYLIRCRIVRNGRRIPDSEVDASDKHLGGDFKLIFNRNSFAASQAKVPCKTGI
jgi:hypothetical protein